MWYSEVEMLVDGAWVVRRIWKPSRWETLSEVRLEKKARRFLLSWNHGETPRGLLPRFRLSLVGQLIAPSLPAGTKSHGIKDQQRSARNSYKSRIPDSAKESDLMRDLIDQARTGLEGARSREATAEQRAGFFLGAAGLTTTLVLANAGLLSGDKPLEGGLLVPVAAILIVTSVLAVGSGVRALQANMTTFARTPAYTAEKILTRADKPLADSQAHELASVLVSMNRSKTIGDWKNRRLADSRRCFVLVIVGMALVTTLVVSSALGG